jgi:hypothetical protein
MHLKRVVVAASMLASSLSGCYVVPVVPDSAAMYPLAPAAAIAVVPPPSVSGAPPVALAARLYPANEAAAQRGVMTGSVTNLMTGRGRFHLDYGGEWLVGEATRVHGDERRGIANAYGPRGTYMSCDYRMRNAQQGTGTCVVSDGARYTVHVGS